MKLKGREVRGASSHGIGSWKPASTSSLKKSQARVEGQTSLREAYWRRLGRSENGLSAADEPNQPMG
jgi:hypothetical protein